MERQQALNRIILLAMKWQDPAHWRIMAGCEFDILHHEEQAIIDRQMSRDPGPFDAALFDESAKIQRDTVRILRSDLLSMRGELLELQNLVRSHAPTLLEMAVTSADISGEIDGTQTDKLKRLEGAVRAMLTPAPESVREEPGRKADAAPPIPSAETLPFSLQRCDLSNWLKREGYRDPVEIREVYSPVMEALMAAAPNAVADTKKEHLKQLGCDIKNAPSKIRDVIDAIGLTVENWTLKDLKMQGYQK